ncbi:M48 family metalloprotease [Candidatus Uhrbacteria bacterium]|nr:M48 family metalloprotease [Candidatus Uhrbacteria bacterium]
MYNQITANKRKTFFLIALFTLIIWGIGAIFGYLYGSPWYGVVPAVALSLIMTLVSYYSGDKIALASSGAKRVSSRDENPYAWNMIENLCIAQGLPMPALYIIDDPAINAFATGRDPRHASVAVTTGAIQKLENEELEGVLAHELSHVKNYDILVMTIVVVLVGVIVLLSDWLFRAQFFGGNNDRGKGGHPALLIIGLALMILAPVIAELIKLAVSRQREYLADASGALATRYPEGLAVALEKIGQETRPLVHANHATAHLYFSNPFKGSKDWMMRLFSTHPPIEDRIARLRGMDGERLG